MWIDTITKITIEQGMESHFNITVVGLLTIAAYNCRMAKPVSQHTTGYLLSLESIAVLSEKLLLCL